MDTASSILTAVGTFLVPSAPGVLVALLTYWLSVGHENALARAGRRNALTLLALEIEGNRAALQTFWSDVQNLDPERAARGTGDTEAHLAAMAEHGWLGYPLPELSYVRWERLHADALAGLPRKAVLEIDAVYRDLRVVAELYTKLMDIPPEERELLNRERFWFNRFAGNRVHAYERLAPVVQHILDRNPLAESAAS